MTCVLMNSNPYSCAFLCTEHFRIMPMIRTCGGNTTPASSASSLGLEAEVGLFTYRI